MGGMGNGWTRCYLFAVEVGCGGSCAWRAALVARAKARGWYSSRWKVETVIVVIMRKFGDSVRR